MPIPKDDNTTQVEDSVSEKVTQDKGVLLDNKDNKENNGKLNQEKQNLDVSSKANEDLKSDDKVEKEESKPVEAEPIAVPETVEPVDSKLKEKPSEPKKEDSVPKETIKNNSKSTDTPTPTDSKGAADNSTKDSGKPAGADPATKTSDGSGAKSAPIKTLEEDKDEDANDNNILTSNASPTHVIIVILALIGTASIILQLVTFFTNYFDKNDEEEVDK